MDDDPLSGFAVGELVRWSDHGYFRVKSTNLPDGYIRIEPLVLRKSPLEVPGEEVTAPLPGDGWPPGYDLPDHFAQALAASHRRKSFANFLRGRMFTDLRRRPYGVLVATSELADCYREFLRADRRATPSGPVSVAIDPHLRRERCYCTVCGKSGSFSRRPERVPAHPRCVPRLRELRAHYCTACGVSFERSAFPDLPWFYWRRQMICPRGTRMRNAGFLSRT